MDQYFWTMNNELKCNNFKFNSPRKSNFKFQQLLATIHIAQTSLLIIPYYVYFLHIYFLSQKKHQKQPLPYLINNKLTFFTLQSSPLLIPRSCKYFPPIFLYHGIFKRAFSPASKKWISWIRVFFFTRDCFLIFAPAYHK